MLFCIVKKGIAKEEEENIHDIYLRLIYIPFGFNFTIIYVSRNPFEWENIFFLVNDKRFLEFHHFAN